MADPDHQASGSNAGSSDAPPTEAQASAGSTGSSSPPPTGSDSLKDSTIEYLAHRSQFGFNALTALMLLVTILYLIVLAVEFYRKGQLEEALTKLNADLADRGARTTLYSNTLKDILLTDFDVDSSNRAFDQKRYLLAEGFVSRGIDRLEATLVNLSGQSLDQRMQNFSFDPGTCTMRESGADAKKNIPVVGTLSLAPIVKDRLAIAYQARILQHYTRQPRLDGWEQSVRRDAYATATFDPGALGIFHWLGIAETALGDFDHAERCYERSLHQTEPHGVDDIVAVDYINLAELTFFKGRRHYGEVEQLAQTFLRMKRDTASEIDVARSTMARFYRAVARYLQSEGAADPRSAELEKFCDELRAGKVNFLGRVSLKELDDYIDRPPRPEDISQEQLTNVKKAIDCLKS